MGGIWLLNNSTWVFTGGDQTRSASLQGHSFRNYISLFEEFIRWHIAENQTKRKERFVTNLGFKGQTLKAINKDFELRIKPLMPANIVYVLSSEEYCQGEKNLDLFENQIEEFINNASNCMTSGDMIVFYGLVESKDSKNEIHNYFKRIQDVAKKYQKSNFDIKIKAILNELEETKINKNISSDTYYREYLKSKFLIESLSLSIESYENIIEFDLIREKMEGIKFRKLIHDSQKIYSTQISNLTNRVTNKEKSITWLFMGDSITQGALWTNGYNSISQEFENFLQSNLKRKSDIVINTAVSGATTQSTLDNIQTRLNRYKPDVVSIMIGANDTVDFDIEIYAKNLSAIINKIKKNSTFIILRTPTPFYESDSNEKIKKIIDVVNSLVEEDKELILVDHYSLINEFVEFDSKLVNKEYNIYTDDRALHLGVNGQLLTFYTLLNGINLLDKLPIYFYNREVVSFSDIANKIIEKK